MSYYTERRKACKEIDTEMSKILDGEKINIPALLLKITAKYEVGDKIVYERIEHYLSAFPQIKKNLLGDTLYLEEGKE